MSVVKMKKLEVWAYASDARDLSRKLLRQKCVDVTAVPLNDGIRRRFDSSEAKRKAEAELSDCEKAIAALTPFILSGKTSFCPDADKFIKDGSAAAARATVSRVLALTERSAETEKELSDCEAFSTAVRPWLGLDIPLGFCGSGRTDAFFGSFPLTVTDSVIEEKTDGLACAFRPVSNGNAARNIWFITEKKDSDRVLRILTSLGMNRIQFPADTPLASVASVSCNKKIKDLLKEQDDIKKELSSLAAEKDKIRVLWDIASTEKTEAELREKMAATDDCAVLYGWVPEPREEAVSSMLSRMDAAYELSDPEESEYESVPVKLHNNAFASCFEWVVGMYSLPAYGSYDPTAVMSVFYVILFAAMMADAGYGLLLILGGFLGPVFMHAGTSLKKAMHMFGWCGVGCLVTGVLFGGYFGNLPTQAFGIAVPALVDPTTDPMTFLIVGLVLGFIHLVAGQVIGFCIEWKEHRLDAVFDYVFYWLIYAGIILLVLGVQLPAYICAGAGAAGVILTAGRKEPKLFMRPVKGLLGLYGLVNFGSDIISYARILAIALSGTVLAQVFNILATMGGTTFKCTAGIVILLVGHILNCVLSALSGFVHTSRLQYVEFFGKFYKDGGRPYAPMLPSERFSKV